MNRDPSTQPLPRSLLGLAAAALLLALAVLLAPPFGAARAAVPEPGVEPEVGGGGSRIVKVLTYNVRGLPLVSDLDRLERIGEILGERRRRGDEPDVVLLQEAYVRRSAELRRRAGYPHVLVGAPDQEGIFPNSSGLELLSNHPIAASYGHVFEDCAFPECFVSKAVVGVTLEIPGVPHPVDVLNTHLQADTENDGVRSRQIDDIADFLGWIRFGRRAAIFAGDFNFKPKHLSYTRFLRKLPFQEAGYVCLLSATRDCRVEIGTHGETDWTDVWKSSHDRHFYYQPERGPLRIEPVRLIRNFTEKVDGDFLSDHWGYEVHYRISWETR